MDLTERQWELIEPLLAMPRQLRGRPFRPARDVVNGILWVMRTDVSSLLGLICLRDFRLTKRATDVFKLGARAAVSKPPCGLWPKTWKNAEASI